MNSPKLLPPARIPPNDFTWLVEAPSKLNTTVLPPHLFEWLENNPIHGFHGFLIGKFHQLSKQSRFHLFTILNTYGWPAHLETSLDPTTVQPGAPWTPVDDLALMFARSAFLDFSSITAVLFEGRAEVDVQARHQMLVSAGEVERVAALIAPYPGLPQPNFPQPNFPQQNFPNTFAPNSNFVNPNLVNPNGPHSNFVNQNFVNPNYVNPNGPHSNFVNPDFVNPNGPHSNFVNSNGPHSNFPQQFNANNFNAPSPDFNVSNNPNFPHSNFHNQNFPHFNVTNPNGAFPTTPGQGQVAPAQGGFTSNTHSTFKAETLDTPTPMNRRIMPNSAEQQEKLSELMEGIGSDTPSDRASNANTEHTPMPGSKQPIDPTKMAGKRLPRSRPSEPTPSSGGSTPEKSKSPVVHPADLYDGPKVGRSLKWTEIELEDLKEGLRNGFTARELQILYFPHRTRSAVETKIQKSKKNDISLTGKPWTYLEREMLLQLGLAGRPWDVISENFFPHKSPKQCQEYHKCLVLLGKDALEERSDVFQFKAENMEMLTCANVGKKMNKETPTPRPVAQAPPGPATTTQNNSQAANNNNNDDGDENDDHADDEVEVKQEEGEQTNHTIPPHTISPFLQPTTTTAPLAPSPTSPQTHLLTLRLAAINSLLPSASVATKSAFKQDLDTHGWPARFASVEATNAPVVRDKTRWSAEDNAALGCVRRLPDMPLNREIARVFFPNRTGEGVRTRVRTMEMEEGVVFDGQE